MSTTSLIVEYLVTGILLLFALLFLAYSLYPQDVQLFLLWLKTAAADMTFVISSLFTAIVYALGVISEPIGRIIFEYPLHDFIKRDRLKRYLKRHKDNLCNSNFLKGYTSDADKPLKISLKDAKTITGEMRFYVLKHDADLYKEIESHIDRLRLIRSLFIVEVLFLFAIIFQIENLLLPSLSSAYFSLFIISVLIFCTLIAIINRLNRYARAVERGYKVLVLCKESLE